jgi:hypothetical protein
MKTIVGVVIIDTSGKFFKAASPKRHSDLIIDMDDYYKNVPYNERPKIQFQGFYTDTNEVISREYAYVLARQTGQAMVKRDNGRLYSEDLW